MASPRVLVLRAPGTNCDEETCYAFTRAGGVAERVHINRLLEDVRTLDPYQVLCIPGGFSYGDDLAAGKILAGKIRHRMAEAVRRMRDDGKLILGICNGFQVLLKAGILLEEDHEGPIATLDWNDSGRFEARWVTLQVHGDRCVFLKGTETIEMPVAHAEGKFIARSPAHLERLRQNGQCVLTYATRHLDPVDGAPSYPDNPNGSQGAVAGVCDPTGRIFGLMPHPERFVDGVQHPQWTRRKLEEDGDGLALFRNAVNYFR